MEVSGALARGTCRSRRSARACSAPAVGNLSMRGIAPRRGSLSEPAGADVNASAASRARGAATRPGLSVLVTGSRSSTAATEPLRRTIRSAHPIRTASASSRRKCSHQAARRRRCSSCVRSTMPDRGSRRPMPRRGSRSRLLKSRPAAATPCCTSATSTRSATSRMSATPSARTARCPCDAPPSMSVPRGVRVDLLAALIGFRVHRSTSDRSFEAAAHYNPVMRAIDP